jgi:hypothetical protein
MKRDIEQVTGRPARILDRDATPAGWSGAAGATEFELQSGYRLWIAPLEWRGTPPASGGATFIGRNACFQFFDRDVTDSPREEIRRVLDIRR